MKNCVLFYFFDLTVFAILSMTVLLSMTIYVYDNFVDAFLRVYGSCADLLYIHCNLFFSIVNHSF